VEVIKTTKEYMKSLCEETIQPLKEAFIESYKHIAKPKYKGRIWCTDYAYKVYTFQNNETAYLMRYKCFTEERFAMAYSRFNLETTKVIEKAMVESFQEDLNNFTTIDDMVFGDNQHYETSKPIQFGNVNIRYNLGVSKVKIK
jgi:hypothetical protein